LFNGYWFFTHLTWKELPGVAWYSDTLGLYELSPKATGRPEAVAELQNIEAVRTPEENIQELFW